MNSYKIKINEWVKNGKSIKELAEKAGINRSYLSTYVNNIDNLGEGTVEKVETALHEFFSKKKVVNNSISFYNTKDAMKVFALLDEIANTKEIGYICGNTGRGKTWAVRKFCDANAYNIIYIRCDESFGVRDLIEEIEIALGFNESYGTTRKRVRKLVKHLIQNPNYLLIVDEADKLLRSFTSKKIEVIRTLWDEVNEDGLFQRLGIVLVGEESLPTLLQQGVNMKEETKRVSDRIFSGVTLRGLEQEEITDILDGLDIDVTEEASNRLIKRGTGKNGNLRLFIRTLKNCLKLAHSNDGDITLKTVEESIKMLAR
ncbi:AAA family ATPase [Vallitalea guaymasensis]|uniref:AAA family ATPase n=1 Tax=Vallitalea guaymasensis TaxID=1185412 RepID=UPI000DE3F67F|nr:AAA family ATPase [Vallitalea guaymasensis]